MAKKITGGGPKKVLYALRTAQRMGLLNSAKALTSHNACKACGLGMGGQLGGMVNELGEFPSVCNKSIQAQSTDIQQPIPETVLMHSLDDLRELNGYELEHLGRLNTPLFKAADSDHYRPVDWDWALSYAAKRLINIEPNRSFFYSSGRSSNEAGFLFQLLARAWGTNNVNNCSYYCHQATGVGMETTIGTGTSTVELADLGLADFILIIGANPSSNHPRFIHKLKAIRDRGGAVIFINPAKEPGLVKFALPKSAKSMITGGSEIASDYLQPRIGGDIALIKGIAKALLAIRAEDRQFIQTYCNGFNVWQTDIESQSWADIEYASGVRRADIERVADTYAKAKNAVFAWGMGVTHHVTGCDTVEYIANLALLRGQIGRPGAGLLPLRGHSNVQGIGTIGVKPVLSKDILAAMEKAFDITLPKNKGFDTMAAMSAADAGNIDAAIIMGGNLFQASPDSNWARRALDKINFKLFMTTTINRSHIEGVDSGESMILPVTARDEEWQPTTQESMFNYVRLSDGGIYRLNNVRPEVAILAELAERMLPSSPINWLAFQQHKTIREAIARIVPGMEPLADIDVAKREFHIANRLLHTPNFQTSDGKANFVTRSTPTPHSAPLILTTVRSEGQFNTIIYEQTDSYRGGADRWTVMLSPEDIAEHGLIEGGTATLCAAAGKMKDVTIKAFDLAKGSVMAYYPEANILIGTEVDQRSRTPSFKATPVWFEPA
jgi:molybdopterin-dependent oxidoreductase alpha subunit